MTNTCGQIEGLNLGADRSAPLVVVLLVGAKHLGEVDVRVGAG